MLKPDQTYEVVIPSIASNAGSYHDGTHWFACYRDKDHQGHWLGEGEAVAVINETKMALLQDEKRRADQLGANCDWLIEQIDRIHVALCPGQRGTWQQRADQAVKAAGELKENLAKSQATHQLLCVECRKPVSTPVPVDTIVRAYLQCPECGEKET
jgi:DNA-directed RNA polymerase subunit RPC12/RpoP